MGRTTRKVPDRWAEYDPIRTVMANTRFVSFKTPLKEDLCNNIDPHDWFTTRHCVDAVGCLGSGSAQLGMVIDLTNTTRYYNSSDFVGRGIEYRKLFCPGHEVDEREDIVEQFIAMVDEYTNDNPETNLLIGVHCTHGINRTGYLICRYLIDRKGWSASQATTAFGEARGYAIERPNYLASLKLAEKNRGRQLKNPISSEESNAAQKRTRHLRFMEDDSGKIQVPLPVAPEKPLEEPDKLPDSEHKTVTRTVKPDDEEAKKAKKKLKEQAKRKLKKELKKKLKKQMKKEAKRKLKKAAKKKLDESSSSDSASDEETVADASFSNNPFSMMTQMFQAASANGLWQQPNVARVGANLRSDGAPNPVFRQWLRPQESSPTYTPTPPPPTTDVPVSTQPMEEDISSNSSSDEQRRDEQRSSQLGDFQSGDEEEIDRSMFETDEDYLKATAFPSTQPMTRGQKRKARRLRQQKMFQTMAKGRFWEIQEMQKEKYGFN